MSEKLHCESVYFKELHNDQEYYWSTTYRAGVACDQALRGAVNSTSNSPVAPFRLSYQISPNQREAETRANVNKHQKTRAKGNDVITNAISANQHFASTSSMQVFKFQRHSCKLSSLFPPHRQSAPESLLAG